MCISSRVVFRHQVVVALFAITSGFGILITPPWGRAQTSPSANQEATQAANAPSSSPPAKKKEELPEGDGKAIAEKYCHACHELTNLTHASKSLDDWRETVNTMVDNGAEVPMDKVDIVVNYLAKNFGPKSGAPPADAREAASSSPSSAAAAQAVSSPLKPGDLPEGDGKEIATNSCQACHTLTNLTDAHMTQDQWRAEVQTMMDRGADIPPEKVDTLVKYLAKNFGPKTPATSQ